MNVKEPQQESVRCFKLALPLMTKHSIPLTPENYKIWYHYVSGTNKELQEKVDSLIKQKEPFSEETNEMLYQHFFVEKPEKKLKEIQESLQQALLDILRELVEISGQTEKYESSVLKSVEKLSEDMSSEDIRSVLGDVLEATKEIRKSGKTAQKRLKDTKGTLEVMQKEFEEAKTELLIDFLTGVSNRKGFSETLQRFVINSTKLCLLMIDIDNFKSFNDKYGHVVGDEVLKFVAKNIKTTLRGTDVIARYGGEEFTAILPETLLIGATNVAEQVRTSFKHLKLKRNGHKEDLGDITVSIGAAQYRSGESLKKFIDRADQALYFAKNHGRNRVATETEVRS
jgi:diguanylate cyclase